MNERRMMLVSTQDGSWEALYVDGKCVAQGHHIRLRDVADVLGFRFASRSTTDTEENSAELSGRLPEAM